MTLANGLWSEEAVYLWADTAFWADAEKPQRKIVMHATKIVMGRAWPFAFVNSGMVEATIETAQAVERFCPRDFVELRDCIRETLAKYVGGIGARVLIASYADKPRLTLIDTDEFAGHPPLTVMECRPWMINSNADRPETKRLIDAGVTVETMRDVIRSQASDWDHEDGALIAGQITCARVSRLGLEAFEVDNLPDPTAT